MSEQLVNGQYLYANVEISERLYRKHMDSSQ